MTPGRIPCRLVARHGFQEAVTPQESSVIAYPTEGGSLSDGQPVDEGLGVVFPALCLAKSCQRRLGENGTGA